MPCRCVVVGLIFNGRVMRMSGISTYHTRTIENDVVEKNKKNHIHKIVPDYEIDAFARERLLIFFTKSLF